jgi:hypothetical protein
MDRCDAAKFSSSMQELSRRRLVYHNTEHIITDPVTA